MFTALLLQVPEDTTAEPGLGTVAFLVVSVAIYLLPAIIGRKKRQATPITLLNLLLGWTVIGWIGALIWAVSADSPAPLVVRNVAPASNPVSAADELHKLQLLRESGTLTEEEFAEQKARVLRGA